MYQLFTLEQIANEHEIVLVDSSMFHEIEDSVLHQISGIRESLSLSSKDLERCTEVTLRNTQFVEQNPNVFTVCKVVEECGEFLEYLNRAANFHKHNVFFKFYEHQSFAKKLARKQYKHRSRVATSEPAPFDDEEKEKARDLALYANMRYRLTAALDSKAIELPSEDTLRRVLLEVHATGIKDYGESTRHYRIRKYSKARITDEYLLVTGYHLAMAGTNCAIISDDSHLVSIAEHCFSKGVIFVPEKGNLSIYADYKKSGHYRKFFDAQWLLKRSNL